MDIAARIEAVIRLRSRAGDTLAHDHWVLPMLDDMVANLASHIPGKLDLAIKHRRDNIALWDRWLLWPSAKRAWAFEELGDLFLQQRAVQAQSSVPQSDQSQLRETAEACYTRALLE